MRRPPPALVPNLIESDDADVTADRGWRLRAVDDASAGHVLRSKVHGSRLSFTFIGRAIAWVGPVAPNQGRARVIVDGAGRGIVDLSATSPAQRRIVFATSWDAVGEHTIEIVVRGGAAARAVGVDAFLVLAED